MTIRHDLTRLLDPRQTEPPPRRPSAPRPSKPPGIYLGFGTHGPVTAGPQHHVLILGPPRSGKTSRIVVPALRRHLGPAVVTSTKPDILTATVAARSDLGRCWYWDPSGTTDPPQGAQPLTWSPVTGCGTWDEAVTRSHSLAAAGRPHRHGSEAHWIERAEALLAVLLHAAAVTPGGDLATLLEWLHRRDLHPPKETLDHHHASRASAIIQGIAETDYRELSGIFSTADGILAAYRTDAALRSTRHPTFNPSDFSRSTDTVYLVSPAAAQNVHAALVVALLDQIRTAAYRATPRPPMLYALDEVANIAPLPDLPATLAEGGSQGLVVLACLQDLSQARVRWDRAADGFLTLFTHKLVLPGIADKNTLESISVLAGDTEVAIRSDSRTHTLLPRSTTTWSTQHRPRLPANRIATRQPGTAILITGTRLQQVAI